MELLLPFLQSQFIYMAIFAFKPFVRFTPSDWLRGGDAYGTAEHIF